MRSLSSGFRKALYAQETGEVALCLLTISHDDLDTPIRLSTDPTKRLTENPVVYGTESRGEQYSFVPIDVVLPDEAEDSAPTARLVVDNTDLGLITAIRTITNAATVKLELVLASDPDTVEIEFPELTVSSVNYDAESVEFELTIDALTAEPFPGTYFLPHNFPGLF